MIAELRGYLPKLKEAGALPFPDKINWALDPDFDYTIIPVNGSARGQKK